MDRIVVEWAPFELSEGHDEAALLEASRALQQEFLQTQAGFLRRELVKETDTRYVDIVWWRSRADAERAMGRAAESAACSRYFSLMAAADHADPGAGVQLFELLATY